jgi:hypothetical protein
MYRFPDIPSVKTLPRCRSTVASRGYQQAAAQVCGCEHSQLILRFSQVCPANQELVQREN